MGLFMICVGGVVVFIEGAVCNDVKGWCVGIMGNCIEC